MAEKISGTSAGSEQTSCDVLIRQPNEAGCDVLIMTAVLSEECDT